MTITKELGRISHASFGYSGYQDAMLGLSLTFESKGWGVQHFDGAWGIERSEHAKWTEEDRNKQLGDMCLRLRDLLSKAKVKNVAALVGVPVEVTFEDSMLKQFRILEEVL